nr:MAG TPA: hypothetical protein [Caudoviricetes sp.]
MSNGVDFINLFFIDISTKIRPLKSILSRFIFQLM